ncbi:chorion class CB protein PC404-like [Anticarsia gemmatalis]|uniref:chorion class CB protein PC404-like n=1 Tax=Anticarsia gemmatalis TaxID=129554 RepID=UPI003F76E663
MDIISAQCIGNALAAEELALAGGLGYPAGVAANNMAYGASLAAYGSAPGYGLGVASTSGGGFAVTSSSPIAPTGITVISENAIDGVVSVVGELPFLSAVAVEGALPTAGAGGINYGCGSGAIGITSEGIAPAYGPVGPAAMDPGRVGYGPGLPAPGLGAPGLACNGFPRAMY